MVPLDGLAPPRQRHMTLDHARLLISPERDTLVPVVGFDPTLPKELMFEISAAAFRHTGIVWSP